MKVLTVNCVDNRYSTGKIIYDISESLKDKCSFLFCYSVGKPSHDNYYRICGKKEYLFYYLLGRITGLKYATGYTSTARLIRFIRKANPDVVHIHCPNTNVFNFGMLLNVLKKDAVPTVITNHAEFFYTGNCSHAYDCLKFQIGCGHCDYTFDPYRKYLFDRTAHEWKLMKKAFENAENMIMVAVSPWVESRIKLSPITNGLKTYTVKNGIDTSVFFFRGEEAKIKLGLPTDKKIVLHVTASFTDEDDPKGGRYIIELANKMRGTLFIVIGNARIKNPEKISDNIKVLGSIADQNLLAEYYSACDLTVITSKRETYGMAVAESLSCGTMVAGFKAGGPESIAITDASEFVEYGNIDALEECIRKNLKDSYNKKALSDKAVDIYSSETMAKGYYEIYRKALGEI